MKRTDFPKAVSDFLSIYLPSQRNFSKNTISSYCDTIKLLLRYCTEKETCSVERLTLKQVNRTFILSFLTWLEEERQSSPSTMNQRLACIHTFFRFVQVFHPELLDQVQQILAIPFRKKPVPAIGYLNANDIKLLLSQPDRETRNGRRDLTLLSLLYDSGARVQELADLTDCSLYTPGSSGPSHFAGKGKQSPDGTADEKYRSASSRLPC